MHLKIPPKFRGFFYARKNRIVTRLFLVFNSHIGEFALCTQNRPLKPHFRASKSLLTPVHSSKISFNARKSVSQLKIPFHSSKICFNAQKFVSQLKKSFQNKKIPSTLRQGVNLSPKIMLRYVSNAIYQQAQALCYNIRP